MRAEEVTKTGYYWYCPDVKHVYEVVHYDQSIDCFSCIGTEVPFEASQLPGIFTGPFDIEEAVMRDMKDFEHFVLHPDETLILRSRRIMTNEEIARYRESLAAVGLARILVLSPDFDVMAGAVEIITPGPAEEPASPDLIEAHKTEVEHAYESGRVIQYKHDTSDDWYDAHRFRAPITFDWSNYTYRLGPKK